MNYAAERFLYRHSRSPLREQFVLKGALLFAVRVGERYRPTKDLDLLGFAEPNEAKVRVAITAIAEKLEAMVDRGISNSRMKDYTDIAMAARRLAFEGNELVAAIRATFGRRNTSLLGPNSVGLSDRFVEDASAQANWKAYAKRNRLRDFESLAQVVAELRQFLRPPLEHVVSDELFSASWKPGGPWT